MPRVDESALVVVRLDGPTLARRRLSRSRGAGVIESLGKKLASVSLSLQPGASGVRAALAYEDDDASAWAENAVRRVVELAGEREGLAWLREATVGREGNTFFMISLPALPPESTEPDADGCRQWNRQMPPQTRPSHAGCPLKCR